MLSKVSNQSPRRLNIVINKIGKELSLNISIIPPKIRNILLCAVTCSAFTQLIISCKKCFEMQKFETII